MGAWLWVFVRSGPSPALSQCVHLQGGCGLLSVLLLTASIRWEPGLSGTKQMQKDTAGHEQAPHLLQLCLLCGLWVSISCHLASSTYLLFLISQLISSLCLNGPY